MDIQQINICIFFLVFLTSSESFSNFTGDIKVTEADWVSGNNETIIRQLQKQNENVPAVCRTDVCVKHSVTTARYGLFAWPEVFVGQRVRVRCPFSFSQPVYLQRDCAVSTSTQQVTWAQPLYSTCPGPPLAQLLDKLDEEVRTSGNLLQNSTYGADVLQRLMYALQTYKGTPVDGNDVGRLLLKIEEFLTMAEEYTQTVRLDIWLSFTHIINTLMDAELSRAFSQGLAKLQYQYFVADQLGMVALHLDTDKLELANLALYRLQINRTETEVAPDVSISLSDTVNGLKSLQTGVVLLSKPYLFVPEGYWSDINFTCSINNYACYPGKLLYFKTQENSFDNYLYLQVSYPQYYGCHHYQDCEATCFQLLAVDSQTSQFCTASYDGPHDDDGCNCSGPGLYVAYLQLQEYPRDTISDDETFNGDPPDMGIDQFLGFPHKENLGLFATILEILSLVCLLATVASYSAFRGILQSLQNICRRARKGNPTTILLNLCVALITLFILLMAVQYTELSFSTSGCTASNLLRYYIIFVTLMWNAIEAFNMYLLLVKVFNAEIKHFALKAGLVAWGVPVVMVLTCLLINVNSFDGQHVVVSAVSRQCEFKCQLQESMLYYGFLIPMGSLMIHNLIVFGLVVRVICKHGQRMEDGRNAYMVQLVGAVATLVLLGVPWLFSVFGVINAGDNKKLSILEGVFQVIFVVLLHLQGVFIFAFHCARNVQVRESWTSVFKVGSQNEA